MVKFVLVFSHLSGFAGKYIGIDPETIKNAAHKSAITKDFYIRDSNYSKSLRKLLWNIEDQRWNYNLHSKFCFKDPTEKWQNSGNFEKLKLYFHNTRNEFTEN